MSDRFFVESPITGDSATLTGQEAVHLTKVLRARVGDVAVLFDGSGMEFTARVVDIKRDAIHCAILERRCIERELTRWVALGVALPKGDRQRVLIEKLTELGAASLTPLITERSVVQPDEQTAVRLRRLVIEASKQCGRNRLMTISAPCKLSEFLVSADPHGMRVFAHPYQGPREDEAVREGEAPAEPSASRNPGSAGASPSRLALSDLAPSHRSSSTDLFGKSLQSVTIAVGPEGGFTDHEVEESTAAGWLQVDLGPRTLRVETAAIALAAIAGIPR